MYEMVAYWLPKHGTALSDWEDGAAYSRATGWFAVADGASTGNNSREWAYMLASSFIANHPVDVFEDSATGLVAWVESTRERFDPKSDEFPRSKAPQWVQRAGSLRGSHATLLAGRLSETHVEALAVGDCCLFHWGSAGIRKSFPLDNTEQFGTSPDLVSSHAGKNEPLNSAVRRYREQLQPGDVIFVASDALAEWLTRSISELKVWELLSRIGHQGFGDLCRDLRANHHMKNDDVTLFRARVPIMTRGNYE